MTTIQPRPDAGSRFRPLAAQPDFPAQEHRILDLWRERRTFLRLRAQNAGNDTWSFLDGPITANNPMGVHHAWGRTYKDVYQRFHAMLGHDQRWQNGFDCQGLWVEVNVERELGFTSKRDIERNGIADFVSLCKQRVLTYAAMQTEQSIRLGMWMDWNDPDELRRLRDLLAADPTQVITIEGPDGPVTDTVEMIVGRLGMPELGGSYFTFSQREQRPHLGLPGRVPQARLAVQGPRLDALVRALRHGHQPDGDERGLPGPRGPGAHGALPAHRPARRVPPGLDHDALDDDRQRGRGRGAGAGLRPGPPGRRPLLARQGDAQDRAPRPLRGARGAPGRRPRGLALRGPVRRAGRRGHRVRAATTTGVRTGTGSSPGTRSARRRARASSTSRPAAAPRTTSWARRSGCRSSLRSTRAVTISTASAGSRASTPRRSRSQSSRTSSARASSTTWSPTRTATRTAGAAARRCSSGSWTSGTSPWACLRHPARRADAGAGRPQPALPDHGRGRRHPVDPGLRLRARARLAAHDGRLDRSPRSATGAWRCPSGSAPNAAASMSSAAATSCASGRSRAGNGSRVTRRTGRTWTR